MESFGDKAIKLTALLKKGYSVLEGYAVSCDIFRNCFIVSGPYDSVSSSITQPVIQVRAFTPDFEKVLFMVWTDLSSGNHIEPLIVRSSAIGEDSSEHSFAGIYESILNVRSFEDMKTAIQKCWASYYSDQAIDYRLQIQSNGMGIIIQKMIGGEKSGVIFTAYPLTGRENESIIEASYGLNMGIVDGTVSADRYSVDRTCKITSKAIAQKKIRYVLGQKSFELQIENVESSLQQVSVLSDDEIHELVEIGRQIENIFGFPCDIEWTIAKRKIYILQCRPGNRYADVT